MKEPILEIKDLNAGVEGKQILKGINLTIYPGILKAGDIGNQVEMTCKTAWNPGGSCIHINHPLAGIIIILPFNR